MVKVSVKFRQQVCFYSKHLAFAKRRIGRYAFLSKNISGMEFFTFFFFRIVSMFMLFSRFVDDGEYLKYLTGFVWTIPRSLGTIQLHFHLEELKRYEIRTRYNGELKPAYIARCVIINDVWKQPRDSLLLILRSQWFGFWQSNAK